MKELRRIACRPRAAWLGGSGVLLGLVFGLLPVQTAHAQTARDLLGQAVSEFAEGRIEASLVAFDELADRYPEDMPYLWQRGIALYYAERWDDCLAQFEAHRAVNPDDVENAAWHYLCAARRSSPRAAAEGLLPVGPDARSPMNEVYDLYRGELAPEAVIEASRGELGLFYGHLYVGLWHEVNGNLDAARRHIQEAARDDYSRPGLYMHMVARVHLLLAER